MLYKRTEYFRHTFGTPLDAAFRIMIADGTGKESGLGECFLIDLSPGGAKMYSKFDIPFQSDSVHLHLEFTLYQVKIDVKGLVVWKKPYHGAYSYGLEFEEDVQKEHLIVKELKLLRKSEIDEKKKE